MGRTQPERGSRRPAPWVQDWGVAVALATLNTSFDPKNLKKTVNLTVARRATPPTLDSSRFRATGGGGGGGGTADDAARH